jgi:hypothetical protein
MEAARHFNEALCALLSTDPVDTAFKRRSTSTDPRQFEDASRV